LLDEDNMVSNSATKAPSQQSTKAYVDQRATFATRTAANGATIDASVTSVRTAGYASLGDGGGSEFVVGSALEVGGFTSADGRFWEIVPAPRYKAAQFGILPQDAGAAALINSAQEWMWRRRSGGILEFRPEKYYIATTINLNYSNVQWIGSGASFHSSVNPNTPWDQAKGTRFVWTKGTADKMAIVRPLVDSSGPALVGVRIEGILFDGVGVASHCLEILSTRAGRFTQIGVTDAITQNMHLGVVTAGDISASEPRDLQHNRFDQIFSRSWLTASLGADGIVIDGDNTSNSSLNEFGYVEFIHKNGAGIVLGSSDNFCFEQVQGFRISGGSGRGVSFIGGSASADNPRNHVFVFTGLGAGGFGVTANSLPPTNIRFLCYSTSNGTPTPTPVQGVDISWNTDNRDYHAEALAQINRDSANVAAPTDGSFILEDSGKAFDDGGTLRQYVGYVYYLAAKAAASFAGRLYFKTAVAGTYGLRAFIGAGIVNDTTTTGGDKGAGTINQSSGYYIQGNQVVGARATGWTAGTGTALKGTFAAYAGQTHTASYVQATVQALDNASRDASQRVKAIEDALRTHGLIN
jgi:hypothetical protein